MQLSLLTRRIDDRYFKGKSHTSGGIRWQSDCRWVLEPSNIYIVHLRAVRVGMEELYGSCQS